MSAMYEGSRRLTVACTLDVLNTSSTKHESTTEMMTYKKCCQFEFQNSARYIGPLARCIHHSQGGVRENGKTGNCSV